MRHKINVAFDRRAFQNLSLRAHITHCISEALRIEGVTVPCEINVLVTDDAAIREINRIQRGKDSATDVLSFPMFTLTAGELPEDWSEYQDPATGLVPLGDMALSLERTRAQAEEFGHGLRRELGYLTIHSVLHLLGYDHMDEGEQKKQMRAREEEILAELVLPR